MFYSIIILPIETIIDWVFTFCFNKLSSFGIISCIVGVSLVINFLALPIYNLADKLQAKERDIALKLAPNVKRIKTAFKGDEQFMILQTYYKQNHYHPLYALRSSLSILIEIPFFIAAYHYLSHCEKLLGTSFWIFKNLAAPDHIFSFTLAGHLFYINILPILMTLINFVSGIVYSKNAPLKEKVQIYGIGLVFLALLYNSPSGLVIYWILNNLFSLVKNIVLKTKAPGLITFGFISLMFALLTFYFWAFQPETSLWKKEALTALTILLILSPIAIRLIKKHCTKLLASIDCVINSLDSKKQFTVFILSALSLSLLMGLYLPSGIISTSPVEFSFLGSIDSPFYYIKDSLYMFLGLFVFWPCCIYFMFSQKIKQYMPFVFITLLIFVLGNVFIFKPEYGNLNPAFEFSDNSIFTDIPKYYTLLSALIIILVPVAFFLLIKFRKTFVLSVILASLLLSEVVISATKLKTINNIYSSYQTEYYSQKSDIETEEIKPIYHLSKTGNNVLVFFLDRAVSSFFPYVLEQHSELQNQFKGFTYFPNTLSYGRNTLNGLPPITGSYEYTPDKINLRDGELLKDKHNEALKVMPKLFLDAGYSVTVVNPSMANYSWGNDLSIYSDMPSVTALNLTGNFAERYKAEKNIKNLSGDPGVLCNKQIKNFSILQGMFPPVRIIFYNTIKSDSSLAGSFVNDASQLYYLDQLTDSNGSENNFVYIGNDTPHDPIFLDASLERPSEPVWETAGNYKCHDTNVLQDYDVNAAAILLLGRYFEYLQKNDLYDNTKIIVVSDHAYYHHYSAFDSFSDATVPSAYNCLLLYKDFNSDSAVKTDDTLMTNADTLYLLKDGLALSDVNPYTGKALIPDTKQSVKVYPLSKNNGNNPTFNLNETQFKFDTPCWEIKENIFDPANWKSFNYYQEAGK